MLNPSVSQYTNEDEYLMPKKINSSTGPIAPNIRGLSAAAKSFRLK